MDRASLRNAIVICALPWLREIYAACIGTTWPNGACCLPVGTLPTTLPAPGDGGLGADAAGGIDAAGSSDAGGGVDAGGSQDAGTDSQLPDDGGGADGD